MRFFKLFLFFCTLAWTVQGASQVWYSYNSIKASINVDLMMELTTGCNTTFLVDKVENRLLNLRVALYDLDVASLLTVEYLGSNQQMLHDLTEVRCNVTRVSWVKLEVYQSEWCVGHIYDIMSFGLDQLLQTLHDPLLKFQASHKPLIVAGFRFGGTYGAMASLMLSKKQIHVNRLVTFGSPPVGNVYVYNYLCTLVHCTRYGHEHDHFADIPLMPFWTGYLGEDLFLTSNGIKEGATNPLVSKRMMYRQAMNEIKFIESLKVPYFGHSKVCV